MVQTSSSFKNIWVAASDGDIDRVRYLVEHERFSPNEKDLNSYTPMHAAASYGHIPLLDYLVSVGGDVNIRDSDEETPLFTVEDWDTMSWLVDHECDIGATNVEGLTAAQLLEEEQPRIAAFLLSLTPGRQQPAPPAPTQPPLPQNPAVSALAVDDYANQQTSSLLIETQRIMEESQRDGTDPDERLREVVERAVRDGFSFGGQVGDAVRPDEDVDGNDGDEERKKPRANGH